MDILELWDALFFVLFIIVVGVTFRRRPMFNKDEATLEDLTKQIEFRWPEAGSSMLVVLYISFQIPIARVDVTDTVFLALIIAYHGILCLWALWQIAKLARQRRQLVRAANASQATEDGAAK